MVKRGYVISVVQKVRILVINFHQNSSCTTRITSMLIHLLIRGWSLLEKSSSNMFRMWASFFIAITSYLTCSNICSTCKNHDSFAGWCVVAPLLAFLFRIPIWSCIDKADIISAYLIFVLNLVCVKGQVRYAVLISHTVYSVYFFNSFYSFVSRYKLTHLLITKFKL